MTRIFVLLLASLLPAAAADTLDIYWIDVEGGAVVDRDARRRRS